MQNAKTKCSLSEEIPGYFSDSFDKEIYVWYEQDWKHDDYEHSHERSQLTFVEEGYQYFHIDQKIYLVPQNHVIWIPGSKKHRITSESETVKLMVVLFKKFLDNDFYKEAHVFPAPPVLKEMLLYASKWNKLLTEDAEQSTFMNAILTSLPNFCNETNFLQIPAPVDSRLTAVCNFINVNFKQQLSIEDLAEKGNMSARSLQRIFKSETGISLKKYIQLIRIVKSVELIDSKQFTLSEIAFKVGYKSLSAFTSSYLSVMKLRPKVNKSLKN